jgi:hypothetical protein
MQRACCLLSALALLAWPAGAEARRMPDRAQIARALEAWLPAARWRRAAAFRRCITG